jgi:hypothetical protein
MNMTALRDIAPCNLVEVHRRFIGACCLHQLFIALIMKRVRRPTFETSVNFIETTRRCVLASDVRWKIFHIKFSRTENFQENFPQYFSRTFSVS